MQMNAIMGDVRVFPLEDGFFIGLGGAPAPVSRRGSPMALAGVGSPPNHAEDLRSDTWFINPRIGFLSTWSWGLTVGIDAGLKIPRIDVGSPPSPPASRSAETSVAQHPGQRPCCPTVEPAPHRSAPLRRGCAPETAPNSSVASGRRTRCVVRSLALGLARQRGASEAALADLWLGRNGATFVEDEQLAPCCLLQRHRLPGRARAVRWGDGGGLARRPHPESVPAGGRSPRGVPVPVGGARDLPARLRRRGAEIVTPPEQAAARLCAPDPANPPARPAPAALAPAGACDDVPPSTFLTFQCVASLVIACRAADSSRATVLAACVRGCVHDGDTLAEGESDPVAATRILCAP